MSKFATLIILVAGIQLATEPVTCQPPSSPTFSFALCRNDDFGSYMTNSPFETSLKTVLSDLVDRAATTAFHNTSAGTVHGQYYCRGDVSPAFCGKCILAASQKALNCSNAKAAIVWYNECTLQYKQDSMYGVTETQLINNAFSRLNLTTPNNFSAVLNQTMSGLIREAAAEGSSGFAVAERPVETLIKVKAHFLVQCGADLVDTAQCQSCLLMALNETRTCCGEWPIILYTFTSSCQVMYNVGAIFYFTPGAPGPPPPPPNDDQVTVTPPSSITPITPTGGSATVGSSGRMELWIVSIGVMLLVLVLHM